MNYFQEATVRPDIKQLIEDILNVIAQPVMERSVKELLWGYEDEVLYQLQQLDPKMVPTTIVSVFNASVIIYIKIFQIFMLY